MNDFISADDSRYSDRERGLIRIGQTAIAKEDEAALDAYFADDFVLHGPDGDADFQFVKDFQASLRNALTGFACERSAVISRGDLVAARTTMSGVFDNTLTISPVGPIKPNGARVVLHLINFFRFHSDGTLRDEWVQWDNLAFLRQLGVEMVPAVDPAP